jgi:Ca-activated chloride channel family protein
VLVLAAGLLVVVSLAGPQYGFKWQEIERRGVDIIIALDCSRSMLAADIQPSRLDRAKREIYDLLTMLQGDRVGLVAFSGTAFLQCPLTIDYPAFYLFLEALTPDYLPVGGSDVVAALEAAKGAFDQENNAEKAVILITDGEHTGDKDPMTAIESMTAADTKVFCIGVGSSDGVPIPDIKGGFIKDASGQIVLSRMDENMLSRMALTTGGSYVRSVAGDMDLDTIYTQQIRAHMKRASVESGRRQVWADRFQWPLALAVGLLLAVCWVPMEKATLSALLLMTVLLVVPRGAVHAGPLQEGFDAYENDDYEQALQHLIQGQLKEPNNPSILYNIGNAYYKTGNFAAAAEHYAQALEKAPPEMTSKLLYNMGNSAYRLGQLDTAIEHYEAALKVSPEDDQARDNLAFVKRQLQQQEQSNQNQDQDQQDNSDKQQGQNQNQQKGHQGQDNNAQPQPSEPSKANPPPQYGDNTQQSHQLNRPDKETQEQQQQQQKQQTPGRQQEAPAEPQSTAAQMLNRLKDQPGRAMMPDYQKRTVEKDW